MGVIGYRSRYDAYFASNDRVADKVFVSINDPGTLASFRTLQSLSVEVRLNDLPSTRFEAKASYVLLTLAGASANAPTISALVEHSGQAGSTMRDRSEQVQLLRPRTTVVQTAKAGDIFAGAHVGEGPDDLSFWGRGIATTWRVTIEPEEMTRRQVDLSNLSAINLEIGYDSFL